MYFFKGIMRSNIFGFFRRQWDLKICTKSITIEMYQHILSSLSTFAR